ncbi:MAG TPA: hypothetical protein VFT87_03990 [Candidatus Saccharimonadales bacterium]|nr:hypothetical protein [Candidatus Saccharimonadales bacterium]
MTLNLFLGVTALMIASGIAYLFANGVRPSTFATFVWGLLGIFLFVFGLGQIIKGAMRIILRTRATTMIYASYVQAEFRPMKLPALQPTDE